MYMGMKYLRVMVILVFGVIIGITLLPLNAQECAISIQTELETLARVCTDASGSSACLRAMATINGVDGSSTVVDPLGVVVGLDEIESVATTGLDSVNNAFGSALLNVYGNVPLALSDAGLRYLMIGDVTLTNAVQAETAFVPAESVMVTAIVAANLRALPSTDGAVVNGAAPGTEMPAFGLSSNREWARVLYNDTGAWISRQIINPQGDLDALPVLTGSENSVMQAFTLQTGAESSDCADALPSFLMIQGPETYNSRMTVNGIDIDFAGTILLRTLPDNTMQFVVLDGSGVSGGVSVPAGFTMFIALGADSQVDGLWTGQRPLTGEELAALGVLPTIPDTILYSPISVPTTEEIAQTLASINAAATGQTVAGPASGQANCAGFRPLSPLATMGNSPQVSFFWDNAPGATGYRLNIFNEFGALVFSQDLNTTNTAFVADTTSAALGEGFNFSWTVDALVDGQVACSTSPAQVLRDPSFFPAGSGSGGPVASPTPCLWGSC
jgi:hypothetical protein